MTPTDGRLGRQVVRSFLKRAKRDIGPATSACEVQAGRRGLVLISPPVRSLLMRKALTLLIFISRSSAGPVAAGSPPAPTAAPGSRPPQRAHTPQSAPHYIGWAWDRAPAGRSRARKRSGYNSCR